MSLRSYRRRSPITVDSIAVKLAIPVAALLLVPVWIQVLGSAMTELDRHLLDLTNALRGWAFVYWSLVHLLFLGTFIWLYVRVRSVEVLTGWPDRRSAPTILASLGVPVVLVTLATAVTTATDAHYMLVSDTAIPWFVSAPALYVAAALWLLAGVLTAVGLLHVVLQSELRTRVSPTVAMAASIAVGGPLFATRGVSFGPVAGGRGYLFWGEHLALLALVAAIMLAVAGVTRSERGWQQYAAVLPLGVVAAGTAARWLGVVDNGAFVGQPVEWSVAGAGTICFGIAPFATVALAAYVYERSETILTPVLVYAVTYLASAVAVLVVGVPFPV